MAMTKDGPRGTWRRSDGEPVEFADAEAAWIAAARQELLETAGRYGAYVTYRQLADRMFEVTGVETSMLLSNLMPKILGPVAQDGHQRGEPPLTALCVRQTGEEIGPAYRLVIELADEQMPADLDKHAAVSRLRCYEFFGADLPPAGGRPALTRKVAAARERAAKREPRAAVICTSCYLQLPPSGRCPNCAA